MAAEGSLVLRGPGDGVLAQQDDVTMVAETQRSEGQSTPQSFVMRRHTSEVLSVEFSRSGRSFLTSSRDKTIQVSSAVDGEQLLVFKGHKRAVTQARWSADAERIFSCSADSTCAVWDVESESRLLKLRGHEGIINTCSAARSEAALSLLASGGDDGETMLFDIRVKNAVASFPSKYPVLSVILDETTCRLYSGALDNVIRVYDVRRVTTGSAEDLKPLSLLYTLTGHTHMVTGLDLSPAKDNLVSFSADQSLRLWDVRPFVPNLQNAAENSSEVQLPVTGPPPPHPRQIHGFRGPTHSFEQTLHRVRYSSDGLTIGVGSSDRLAHLISVEHVAAGLAAPQLIGRLEGHTGAVTEVAFHPTAKAVLSGSVDKTARLRVL